MYTITTRSAIGIGLLCVAGVINPLSAQDSPTMTFRAVLAAGATYIHQPSFSYTSGITTPRTVWQQGTDGGGVTAGGAIEFERGRLWGGLSAHVVVPIFSDGTAQIFAAYGGAARRTLGGTFRVAVGPVLVRGDREERGLRFCLQDCVMQYPPALVSGGVGLTVVQEWRAMKPLAIGVEGQAVSGAQRFASVRIRLALGDGR